MDEIHTSLGTATSAALLAGGARAGEDVWGGHFRRVVRVKMLEGASWEAAGELGA